MTKNTSTTMTRRIGSTTYKVRAFFKEDGNETMEDKIMRMIQREGLASPLDCGMMNVPQMDRQSERSAS
ncbi:MAG: transposon-encoded TnpW family protein [Oscillospiraceae bacterium]|nr:transposon-encoded TnpW family protein [Oscillospiraceae bacterium]